MIKKDSIMQRREYLAVFGACSTVSLPGCGDNGMDEKPDDEKTIATDTNSDDTEPAFNSSFSLPKERTVGADVTIEVDVQNIGGSSGEFIGSLVVRSSSSEVYLTETRSVNISANESVTLRFTVPLERVGNYTVELNENRIGEVTAFPETLDNSEVDTVRTVGAHYYPWYGSPGHSQHGGRWSLESPSTPLLGNYNSGDVDVLEHHIDWCNTAGIEWLNVSWWGPQKPESRRFRKFLTHPRASELEWSILYESAGRLPRFDLNFEESRNIFVSDFTFLARNFFNQDAYRHVDGRPVVYLYLGGAYRGDIEGTFEDVVAETGTRPYIISDGNMDYPLTSAPISKVADAISPYSAYTSRDDIKKIFLNRVEETYQEWNDSQTDASVDFIPTVIPGFDDTEITNPPRDNPPLPPSPERYTRVCEIADRYSDGPVLVTSFNEWYEDTQIEPSEEFGAEYLSITRDVLATRNA